MENTYTSKMDKEENSSINEDKAAANPLPTLSSTVDISQLNEIFVNKCETDKLVPNDNVNTSDNNGHAIATTVYVPETRTPELPTVDSPPASKKPKLSLAKLKNKITIEAIISDTFITDIPLRNVISCVIGDRKQAAKLVNSLPPLPQNLLHLKRIRTRGGRLEIIVCPPPDTTEQEINDPISAVREMLQLQNPDSWRGLDLSLLHLSPVASSLPLCRKQYDAVFTYWPCNFHPDRPIEEIMSENAGFSGVEIEEIYNIVTTQVMEHSRRHENRQVCLVYDPSGDKEILVCTLGQGGPNPLNHAVMVAVEQFQSQKWTNRLFMYWP
ncbi:uncharacterized protein LOC110848847 [Folsomia candida]|uniref:uncharacterized protein LOC110848847 n=1 Tax=Folsomia candida TaxID=158441 RepID=UPI000B8F76B4|nr:uncharacterized protein LOC110848847 [Folsomia candida]